MKFVPRPYQRHLRPSLIMTSVRQTRAAKARSWVETTIVRPRAACSACSIEAIPS